jgi:hypothetical protein
LRIVSEPVRRRRRRRRCGARNSNKLFCDSTELF